MFILFNQSFQFLENMAMYTGIVAILKYTDWYDFIRMHKVFKDLLS